MLKLVNHLRKNIYRYLISTLTIVCLLTLVAACIYNHAGLVSLLAFEACLLIGVLESWEKEKEKYSSK